MNQSDLATALRRPHHHQKMRGGPYLDLGCEPEIPPGIKPLAPVMPPAGTPELSRHELVARGGAPIMMRWVDGRWMPKDAHAGNRMAFTPEYLGRAGWAYGKKA